MLAVRQTANVSTCSLQPGSFGHATEKTTILMGTNNIVQKLKNEEPKAQAKRRKDSRKKRQVVKKKPSQQKVAKKPASLVNIVTRANGTKAVTRIKGNLQIYPVQYALAICQLQWPAHFVECD